MRLNWILRLYLKMAYKLTVSVYAQWVSAGRWDGEYSEDVMSNSFSDLF